MASESPGGVSEVCCPCSDRDTNQCLIDETRHPPSRGRARTRPLGLSLPGLLLLLSLLPGLAEAGAGGGLCDPLLCTCEASSANCSYRGFLSLPSGLHYELKTLGKKYKCSFEHTDLIKCILDLSNNDIRHINRTEFSQYNNLEVLDLSRNRITTFEGLFICKCCLV